MLGESHLGGQGTITSDSPTDHKPIEPAAPQNNTHSLPTPTIYSPMLMSKAQPSSASDTPTTDPSAMKISSGQQESSCYTNAWDTPLPPSRALNTSNLRGLTLAGLATESLKEPRQNVTLATYCSTVASSSKVIVLTAINASSSTLSPSS